MNRKERNVERSIKVEIMMNKGNQNIHALEQTRKAKKWQPRTYLYMHLQMESLAEAKEDI